MSLRKHADHFGRSFPIFLAIIAGIALPVIHPAGAARLYAQAPPTLTVDRGGTATSLRLGANPPFHTTARDVQNERMINVSGSPVFVVLWDEIELNDSPIPFYGISLDGFLLGPNGGMVPVSWRRVPLRPVVRYGPDHLLGLRVTEMRSKPGTQEKQL